MGCGVSGDRLRDGGGKLGAVQPVGPRGHAETQPWPALLCLGKKAHSSVFELAGVRVQGVRADCSLGLQGRR